MMTKIFISIFFIILCINVYSQDYIFFSDSPNSTYFDPSWGFANIPSTLERINENKFPVSTTFFFSGINSLKLSWNSKTGGDWGMALASDGWVGHDVLLKDSITFFVYTDTPIGSSNLPVIYLEDMTNIQTPKQNLSVFSENLQANVWIKISVPLSIFINDPGSANLNSIKTIFFGQNQADEIEHTLYIDEVRMVSAIIADTIRPLAPIGLLATGYEKHIDLQWLSNTESDLMGYYLYNLVNNEFVRIAVTNKEVPFFEHFLEGNSIPSKYKITAFDSSNNESLMSNEVSATTHSMTDDEFLDMVQRATFRYFYDYGHPVSGLSRERFGSEETVTSGGSGFGVMALLVGIDRGYISRDEGIARILKILNFLNSEADRFHGAFSHWLNGSDGNVIPFSTYDNGGDLVETSYMIQGLYAVRRYFDQLTTEEQGIRDLATQIIDGVEWDWYRRYTTSDYLYWHWSPNFGWIMDMTVQGPNEAMIVYLLGIASTSHGVPASLFHNGWASSSYYVNTKSFYGYRIWVGWDYGGPLFFQHYSFLGFDPRDKKDIYCNYFNNAKNITLIHRSYSIANPNSYIGYNDNCWGLTASDDPAGYGVHEPTNDNGTITPSAALSSMPYTPNESIEALKYFYRTYENLVWGEFGFKDAFNPTQNWYADSYLAIDQGPIICMIENYRSGLLWDNFMANPEVQTMMDAIGFVDDPTDVNTDTNRLYDFDLAGNYPNPFNPTTIIEYSIPVTITGLQTVRLVVYDILGREIATLVNEEKPAGRYKAHFEAGNLSSGAYFYKLTAGSRSLFGKMIIQK